MTRSILARLVALAIITLAGVYYIAFDAVGIRLWDGPYPLHVVLPTAGGIYTDAYVTYRGVEVGKVSAIHLHPDDVVVDLAVSHGTRIPAGSRASVRELTALGEQYLDLEPPAGAHLTAGRYLRPGATIPEDRTTVPSSIGTLLDNLDSLVGSLNTQELDTLTSTLATGLQGTGAALHSIVVDAAALTGALQSAIPGTQQLIDSGGTVLSTFNRTGGDFQDLAANLDSLTSQVAASNSTLVSLLHSGSSGSRALSRFLEANAAPTVSLINELSGATGVAYAREPAIRALFEVLPLFSQNVAMTVSGGQLHFQLDYNTADPVCPYTTDMVEPTSLVAAADLGAGCDRDAPGLLPRGADKAPPPRG